MAAGAIDPNHRSLPPDRAALIPTCGRPSAATEPARRAGRDRRRSAGPTPARAAHPPPWPGSRMGCVGARRRSRSAAAQDQAYEPRPSAPPTRRPPTEPAGETHQNRWTSPAGSWGAGERRREAHSTRVGQGEARCDRADLPVARGVLRGAQPRPPRAAADRRSTDRAHGRTGSSGAVAVEGRTFHRGPDRLRGAGTLRRAGARTELERVRVRVRRPHGGHLSAPCRGGVLPERRRRVLRRPQRGDRHRGAEPRAPGWRYPARTGLLRLSA